MTREDASLGEILVERGLLNAETLASVQESPETAGRPLGDVLVEKGLLDEAALRRAFAEQIDLPLVRLRAETLDPEALARLPAETCRRYAAVPVSVDPASGGQGDRATLVVAVADPSNTAALSDLATQARCPVRPVAALREEIEAVLEEAFGGRPERAAELRRGAVPPDWMERVLEDPTGTELLRHLLTGVVSRGEGGLHLRLRGDEVTVEDLEGRVLFSGGRTWHTILLDRLRRLAALSGGEGGVLQKGRFGFGGERGEEPALFRLSILKGVEGEEAQMKLLRREGEARDLPSLGLTTHQWLQVREALSRPGFVWVTASGEEGLSSTLFALLREVPDRGRALTLEDEVFYRSPDLLQLETLNLGLEGRGQVLRELKYLDFTRVMVDRVSPARLDDLLALALRHRWVLAASGTASLQESLSVLASRSRELPLYGVRLLVHQRLLPRLCPHCREECVLGTAEQHALARWIAPGTPLFQEGDGCRRCEGRGTAGVRGFFEVLPVDVSVREDLYAEGRGERRMERLLARVSPSIRQQVAEASAQGEVALSELWELL
ncbi:MAG: hypothetical protein Kow0092_19960 [Deferrisomatales bacterium]